MNQLSCLLAAVGVVFVPDFVSACDICGCAGGGNSMGLLPLVQRHFAGFRWQTQVFSTAAHDHEASSVETFRTLDLWGRWQPHRRVQVIANLPWQFSERHFENGTSRQANGLGDAALLAQFALLDPDRQSVRAWQHTRAAGFSGGRNQSASNPFDQSLNRKISIGLIFSLSENHSFFTNRPIHPDIN